MIKFKKFLMTMLALLMCFVVIFSSTVQSYAVAVSASVVALAVTSALLALGVTMLSETAMTAAVDVIVTQYDNYVGTMVDLGLSNDTLTEGLRWTDENGYSDVITAPFPEDIPLEPAEVILINLFLERAIPSGDVPPDMTRIRWALIVSLAISAVTATVAGANVAGNAYLANAQGQLDYTANNQIWEWTANNLSRFSSWVKHLFGFDDDSIERTLNNQLLEPVTVYYPENIYPNPYNTIRFEETVFTACMSEDPVYSQKIFDDIAVGTVWDSRSSLGGVSHYEFPNGAYWTVERGVDRYGDPTKFYFTLYSGDDVYTSSTSIIHYPSLTYGVELWEPLVIRTTNASGVTSLNIVFPLLQYCYEYNYGYRNMTHTAFSSCYVNGTTQVVSSADVYNILYEGYDPSAPPEVESDIVVDEDTGVVTNNVYNVTYNPNIDYALLSEAVQEGVENAKIIVPLQQPVSDVINNYYDEGTQITRNYTTNEIIQAQTQTNSGVVSDIPPASPEPADNLDTPAESIDKMKLSQQITYKFPFSIPWDLKRCFDLLVCEPVEPVFTFNFVLPIFDIQENIVIDLTDSRLDDFFRVFRFFVFVLFIFCLAVGTRSLIRG